MDWQAILQFCIEAGIVSAVVAALIKIGVKIAGDKLGWDEKKKAAVEERLEGWGSTAIHYAEEAAKHRVFDSKEAQSAFKEKIAVELVAKNMGVDEGVAKAAVRAALSMSSLSKPMAHDEAAFVDTDDPEALIAAQGG